MVRREYHKQGIGESLVDIIQGKVSFTSCRTTSVYTYDAQAAASKDVLALSTTTALNVSSRAHALTAYVTLLRFAGSDLPEDGAHIARRQGYARALGRLDRVYLGATTRTTKDRAQLDEWW